MKKDELLVPRLDFLIPANFFALNYSRFWRKISRVDKVTAIGRVVELNPEWAIEVVNNLEHRLEDVLHDFIGIYEEDEHFVPRIQADDVKVNEIYEDMKLSRDYYRQKYNELLDVYPNRNYYKEESEKWKNEYKICETKLKRLDSKGEFTDDDEYKKYQSDAWVEAQRDAGEDA